MLKLIVFDCDGVMFDSKKANCKFYNDLLSHFDLPPMDREEEEFVHMNNATSSVRHIFRRCPDETIDKVNSFRLTRDYTPYLSYMEMEPDLVEFLEITRKKYRLAISTNRSNTMMPLLEHYNLTKYYEKVVTADTAKRPKPAPDGLAEILDHVGCLPEEAVFIGDSIIDEEHAKSCNVDLIAFRNKGLNGRYHVDNFLEILDLDIFNGD